MSKKTFLYDGNNKTATIKDASRFVHLVLSDSGEMLQEHTGIINRKS